MTLLGFISLGGPTGQTAMTHMNLVGKKKMITENEYLQPSNFCMLLPGPEAQEYATDIGWLLNGKGDGLIADGPFVLPSIIILRLFAWLYASLGSEPSVAALLSGLRPIVVAIVPKVPKGVLRIGRKWLKTGSLYPLAAAACIGISVFNLPLAVIVLSAGLCGSFSGTLAPALFLKAVESKSTPLPEPSRHFPLPP